MRLFSAVIESQQVAKCNRSFNSVSLNPVGSTIMLGQLSDPEGSNPFELVSLLFFVPKFHFVIKEKFLLIHYVHQPTEIGKRMERHDSPSKEIYLKFHTSS